MEKSIRYYVCISFLPFNNHNLNTFLKYKESSCKAKFSCTLLHQKACMDPKFGLLKNDFKIREKGPYFMKYTLVFQLKQ